MQRWWLTVWLIVACAGTVAAAEDPQYVVVVDPYVDMRTGPGEGYPVTQVIERGERVGILKRRTDWFKVRSPREKEGWVHIDQLEATLQPSGDPVDFPKATLTEYRHHTWEFGALAGDFGGATAYTFYGSKTLSKHLSAETGFSQILGDVSDGWSITANLVHTFVPERRVSPFFLLGTGIIQIEPKSTLAQSTDRRDPIGIVGVGVKAYISERFMLRAEYQSTVVFSSRNDNEDVDEWKAGFAVFF